MKIPFLTIAAVMTLLAFTACSDRKQSDANAGGMKCGAGKCGANMVSGQTELAKKQRTILSQMSTDDPRMGCVMNADTTGAVYDCVRNPETGELTLEYNASTP